MPCSATTEPFEQLVVQSGLITAETLHALKTRFPARTRTGECLARLLLEEQLLTPWQAEQLQAGKHRGFIVGSYRLQSHLARGGMSTLYAARHSETGTTRALKVLSPVKAAKASYLPRFVREARLSAKLRHANIVRVFGLEKIKAGGSDIHFIVMELLEGCDLYCRVAKNGPLPVREAAELIRQAATGLSFAHKSGLVHRDVKPGNLFLTHSGTVKVVDLGLAAAVEDQEESVTRLCSERVLGTADYLAPEQAIDTHRADSRADIYALGCTFYFLLTGRPPFDEGSLAQRILAHQTKDPHDVRQLRNDVPDELAELLTSMMVKRRARRIQTCDEVALQLETWLAGDTNHQEPGRPAPLTRSPGTSPTAGRKLKRITRRRCPAASETPTDTIRSAETKNHSGIGIPTRPANREYCREFESFLENPGHDAGLMTVMSPEEGQHARQKLMQDPELTASTASDKTVTDRVFSERDDDSHSAARQSES